VILHNLKIMKKSILFSLLLFVSFQIKAIDFYKGTYPEAIKEAETQNKLILLYFTAKWCGPCQYMSKYIFTVEEVHQKVSENYIALELDIDIKANQEIYYKYNADKGISIPKFFFINSKEEVIKFHYGALKLNQFKDFIDIPDWSKPITKAESDSIAISRVNSNSIKPSAFNKFMHNVHISRWKPGLRLGMNYYTVNASGSSINYDKHKFGLNIGMFLDYTTRSFLFQPGISLSSKGAKISNANETPNGSLRLNYIEVPIRFSINTFNHKIVGCAQSVRLNFEPYGAYALNGNLGNGRVQFGSSENEFDRFDYGIKSGISLQMGSFEPSFGYDLGLNNLSNKSGEKIYNRGFYFNFALIFGK